MVYLKSAQVSLPTPLISWLEVAGLKSTLQPCAAVLFQDWQGKSYSAACLSEQCEHCICLGSLHRFPVACNCIQKCSCLRALDESKGRLCVPDLLLRSLARVSWNNRKYQLAFKSNTGKKCIAVDCCRNDTEEMIEGRSKKPCFVGTKWS